MLLAVAMAIFNWNFEFEGKTILNRNFCFYFIFELKTQNFKWKLFLIQIRIENTKFPFKLLISGVDGDGDAFGGGNSWTVNIHQQWNGTPITANLLWMYSFDVKHLFCHQRNVLTSKYFFALKHIFNVNFFIKKIDVRNPKAKRLFYWRLAFSKKWVSNLLKKTVAGSCSKVLKSARHWAVLSSSV